MIAGLRRFYRDHGFAPTSSNEWLCYVNNRHQHGARRRYPSVTWIWHYWPTFVEAWEAAGVYLVRGHVAWTETEDWYIRESHGLITREEIARDLRRTPDAVHRRQYDLGLFSRQDRSKHGWTINLIQKTAHMDGRLLLRWNAEGLLPIVRGTQCFYIKPEDLVTCPVRWERADGMLMEATLKPWRARLLATLYFRLHYCIDSQAVLPLVIGDNERETQAILL